MKKKIHPDIQTQNINGREKYFCLVRKSYIPATPEEKVRQNFLHFLIYEKQFPINKIKVEASLAHYDQGIQRVDILILDQNNDPFIIYECKKEFETITDDIIAQVQGYYRKLGTVVLVGIVYGDIFRLVGFQDGESKPRFYEVHPDYYSLINNDDLPTFAPEVSAYQRNAWKAPVDKEIIEELVEFGVIGEGTHEGYHSFLVNIDGWFLDVDDKLEINENIEDIGIKRTKFGNAAGAFFTNDFRSFLVKNRPDKPIICIALTAMDTGKNSPIRTSIYVGVETTHSKNSSLQIQVEKSIRIVNGKVIIEHNGAITVGRLGASKKQDLIDFVYDRNPKLIKNGKVFLGSFELSEEINSTNVKPFIENVISYALLRNEFREIKKEINVNK